MLNTVCFVQFPKYDNYIIHRIPSLHYIIYHFVTGLHILHFWPAFVNSKTFQIVITIRFVNQSFLKNITWKSLTRNKSLSRLTFK